MIGEMGGDHKRASNKEIHNIMFTENYVLVMKGLEYNITCNIFDRHVFCFIDKGMVLFLLLQLCAHILYLTSSVNSARKMATINLAEKSAWWLLMPWYLQSLTVGQDVSKFHLKSFVTLPLPSKYNLKLARPKHNFIKICIWSRWKACLTDPSFTGQGLRSSILETASCAHCAMRSKSVLRPLSVFYLNFLCHMLSECPFCGDSDR